MKAEHTKTPWEVKRVATSMGYCYKVGSPDMANGPYGAICLYDDNTTLNPHSEGVQEANADFIVKACNSYDQDQATISALVGALEEITKGEGAFNRDPLTHAGNTIGSMKAIANAAVAEAEKGSI